MKFVLAITVFLLTAGTAFALESTSSMRCTGIWGISGSPITSVLDVSPTQAHLRYTLRGWWGNSPVPANAREITDDKMLEVGKNSTIPLAPGQMDKQFVITSTLTQMVFTFTRTPNGYHASYIGPADKYPNVDLVCIPMIPKATTQAAR